MKVNKCVNVPCIRVVYKYDSRCSAINIHIVFGNYVQSRPIYIRVIRIRYERRVSFTSEQTRISAVVERNIIAPFFLSECIASYIYIP